MDPGFGIAIAGFFLSLLGAFVAILFKIKRKVLPQCDTEFTNIKSSLAQGRDKFNDLFDRDTKNQKDIREVKTDLKYIKKNVDKITDPLLKYLEKNGN